MFPGRLRVAGEPHAGLLQRSIPLAGVARTTGSHDVLPGVRSTSRTRHHMVEVLGLPPAVLAGVAIPDKHGSPVERHPAPVWDLDVPHQSDDRGHCDRHTLRRPVPALFLDHLGLVPHQEHDGAPRRDHRKWLVGGVQHQGLLHQRRLPAAPTGTRCSTQLHQRSLPMAEGRRVVIQLIVAHFPVVMRDPDRLADSSKRSRCTA